MEIWLLSVKSYTEAMRGKNYLEGLNINCSVEKISGRGGCGFVIRVKGSAERAVRLLGTAGINVTKVIPGKKR